MHAPLDGGDAVGEAVDALVVARVPLERELDLLVGLGLLEVGNPLEQGLLRLVHVADVVDDAARVLVDLLLLVAGALVAEADLEALVEERHDLQPLEDRLGPELGALGREDAGIGPERDRGAGAVARRLAGDGQLALGLAPVGELHPVALAVAVDLELESLRQRVHDRHAHAVQAARDLVARAAELAPRVQHGEHDLGRRLGLVLRVRLDRDSPPVVDDAAAAVGQQGDVDARAVTGHRLVDRVVDDLVDEVVKAVETGRPDVHPGAFSDGFEALQDGDVLGPV